VSSLFTFLVVFLFYYLKFFQFFLNTLVKERSDIVLEGAPLVEAPHERNVDMLMRSDEVEALCLLFLFA